MSATQEARFPARRRPVRAHRPIVSMFALAGLALLPRAAAAEVVSIAIGGYSKDGFEKLSRGVDGALGAPPARLKMLVETGATQSAAS